MGHHRIRVEDPNLSRNELLHERKRAPISRMGSEDTAPISGRNGVRSAPLRCTTLDVEI